MGSSPRSDSLQALFTVTALGLTCIRQAQLLSLFPAVDSADEIQYARRRKQGIDPVPFRLYGGLRRNSASVLAANRELPHPTTGWAFPVYLQVGRLWRGVCSGNPSRAWPLSATASWRMPGRFPGRKALRCR